MRIVCVYTVDEHCNVRKPIAVRKLIPFGISYIATVLKHAGHEVRLLVATARTHLKEELSAILTEFDPGLFCLTAVSTQFPLVMNIAETVKSIRRDTYVAVGGTHVSLNPHDAISLPQVDAVCVGEGEDSVVELAAALDGGKRPSGIANFWFRQVGSEDAQRNRLAPFNEDLDRLPLMDRDMWKPWVANPDSTPAVLLGRGCPNACSYCSNHILRKLGTGRYVRFRSVANVMAEIGEVAQDSAVREIYLEVETIASNLRYAFELTEALEQFNKRRSEPIRFAVNLALSKRICDNDMTKLLLEAFNRANIRTLAVGLESGSERIRNEVLRRPRYSNQDFLDFCRAARTHGIGITGYVMLGLPTETLADWHQTVELARKGNLDEVLLSIFYPYPGTDLYDKALEQGLFKPGDLYGLGERRNAALDLPGFPKWRIMLEYVLFPFKFLKGRASLPRRLYWSLMLLSELHCMLEPLGRLLSPQSLLGRTMRRFLEMRRKPAAPNEE